MLSRDPAAVLLANKRAVGNTHQGVVGVIEAALFEIDVIGCDNRHIMGIGKG